jgi:hypothetical protein
MSSPSADSGGTSVRDSDARTADFALRTSGSLVRLGRLAFDDFCLLDELTLRSVVNLQSTIFNLQFLWPLALSNAPHVLNHLKSELPDLDPALYRWPDAPSLERIHQAQDALVRCCAFELLRAKAPPLWDALPWNEWDFESVIKRFQLWRTRFLLAGDGTTVVLPRLRKSAGVVIHEPLPFLRRYLEGKAAKEKVRRLRFLTIDPLDPGSLEPILPADVALFGSPSLPSFSVTQSLAPFISIRHLFLVENNPLRVPLDPAEMKTLGFIRSEVEVRNLGPRPVWTRTS